MKRTHRLLSLLLSVLMLVSLLPVTAFAEETTQTGKAKLIGFAAGQEAGNASIQNNGMTIMAVPDGVKGNNPMNTDGAVGRTATLSPYCPPYGRTQHPKYVYNDYNATAIIVEETGRRLLKGDTFKAGTTYLFTFQDTSWPVSLGIKGGGYLGELTEKNFTIEGAKVIKAERVTQRLNLAEDREMQGFFYNVWITIDGTQSSYAVTYTSTNVTVDGLSNTATTVYPSKTGYAKEGDKITLTADKVKSGYFFTGWKFTTDDGKFYMDKDYIQWYCSVTDYTSNEGGSDKVTCSFRMGDKNLKVEALYGKPGSAGVGNVTFNNIKLWVMPPVKGAKGVTMAVPEFNELGTTYQIGKVEWLEDNETGAYNYLCMDPNKTFDTANKCYTMRVMLKLKDGYAFSDKNGVTITINGETYGTGTENHPLYNRERRTMPVTYEYSETNKSLAIYISVGGDGVKTRLEDRYKAYAALEFVDAPSIDSVTVTDASGHFYGTPQTASDFTMALEQGINYDVQVKVRVPKAIQTAINSGLMQLQPQFRHLMNSADMGTNLWQGTQVTKTTDATGDTIYTYSTIGFGPVAGESYKLVFGTNLVTTGADAQRIAGNIISGTFNCVNTKIKDGPAVTGNALKAGDTSGPVLTTTSTQYYIDTENTRAWDIPATGAENGKTYWTMLCLRPNPGYVFDPGYDYTPAVTLGGAAAKTNYAVAVDGSAMFLTVYATAVHEHVMGFVDNGDGTHIYKCTVSGCYSYNGYKEAHIWGEGTVSGDKITYTCEKCHATTEEDYTAPGEGVTTIYGFYARVTTPKAGDTVDGKNWLEMRNNGNGKVQVAEAKWTNSAGEAFTGAFAAGETYTITATFEAAEGYKINESTSDVLLNRDGTAGSRSNDAANRTVTQSMTFTVKKPVDVKITLPDLKAGEKPSLSTYEVDDDAIASITCMVSVNEKLYTYSAGAWDKVLPELKADDVVTYVYTLTPNVGYEFANTTIVANNAENLTDRYDGDGGVIAIYTIPNANAISKVALTVSGYEYGKSVSAAAKGTDPANVTTGAWNWNPKDTTFGAKVYTVTIPVTPAEGYIFTSGCLFTVNGYPATYDATNGTVTCEMPALTAPHTHDFGSWTYLNDAVHYHTCKTEGCGTTEMKAHSWEKTGEVEATTTATGSVTYKCSDCGAEKAETTPKLPETVDPGKPDQPDKPGKPDKPDKPSKPGKPGDSGSTGKDVKSSATGDAGIALYAGLALLSVSGGAWTFARKRKESDR